MRRPLPPNSHSIAAAALAKAAVVQHAPAALTRGGPVQRAARLVEDGFSVPEAAGIAAKQGKGHVAEIHQSASFTAMAAAGLRPHTARPNPRANDPIDDVQVRRGGRTRTGAQVKVGSAAYVRRAALKSRAKQLVVNEEAFEAVSELLPVHASKRLTYRSSNADVLSADECHRVAADAITESLSGCASQIGLWVACARAGARSGLESFTFSVLQDLVAALLRQEAIDAKGAIARGLSQGARAGTRGCLQSYLLVQRFATSARARFSERLLHRIGRSTIVMGAIAEVLIETAVDLHAVLTKKMTFEDLLRRFGVHAITAAGGVAGVALAVHLARDHDPLIQFGAALLGGFLGSAAGRELGTALFLQSAPLTVVGPCSVA